MSLHEERPRGIDPTLSTAGSVNDYAAGSVRFYDQASLFVKFDRESRCPCHPNPFPLDPDDMALRYFRLIDSFSGKLREEPPTRNVYSPDCSCHASRLMSNTERNHGSISMVTSRLSPGSSLTLLHPPKRLGGSPALAGKTA